VAAGVVDEEEDEEDDDDDEDDDDEEEDDDDDGEPPPPAGGGGLLFGVLGLVVVGAGWCTVAAGAAGRPGSWNTPVSGGALSGGNDAAVKPPIVVVVRSGLALDGEVLESSRES
jgi:hypothetical protein